MNKRADELFAKTGLQHCLLRRKKLCIERLDANKASNHRENSQKPQRPEHHRRRLTGVSGILGFLGPTKNNENEPEYVKGSKNRDDLSQREESVFVVIRGLVEQSVLAEEPAHGPHASQGQRACDKGPECDRHFLSQSAHFPNVLLMVQSHDDRARSQK